MCQLKFFTAFRHQPLKLHSIQRGRFFCFLFFTVRSWAFTVTVYSTSESTFSCWLGNTATQTCWGKSWKAPLTPPHVHNRIWNADLKKIYIYILFYHLSITKLWMAVWLSPTGRPSFTYGRKKKSLWQKMLFYGLTWNVLSAPLSLHYLTQCNICQEQSSKKKKAVSMLKLYCGNKKKSLMAKCMFCNFIIDALFTQSILIFL